MKIKKTTKPISNEKFFNERDMLYDIKESIKQLLNQYFNFMSDVTSKQNFNKIEEITYELIEDYQNIKQIIYDQGWLEYDCIDNETVVNLIRQLKTSRKQIEDNY